MLLMAFGVCILSPITMDAQQAYDGGGLFQRGARNENNNRNSGVDLGGATQENPTEVPLGNGITVLMAAGIGYATMKRKEIKK